MDCSSERDGGGGPRQVKIRPNWDCLKTGLPAMLERRAWPAVLHLRRTGAGCTALPGRR